MTLCECGCGKMVKYGNRYINGHNSACISNESKIRKSAALSKALKGRKFTEEHKRKLSLARKGRSPANKGVLCSEEQKKKISDTLTGRKLSYEHKKKIRDGIKRALKDPNKKASIAHVGRKLTDEHKMRISAGCRKVLQKAKENNVDEYNRMTGVGKKASANWLRAMKSPEIRKKRAKSLTGRKLSDKHKKNIGLAFKGKPGWSRGLTKETDKRVMNMAISQSGDKGNNWKGGISNEPYCDAWADKEYKEDIKERDNYTCQNPYCWGISERKCIHHIDYNKKNCNPESLITLCNSCNSRANRNREFWKEFYLTIILMRQVSNA